MEQGTKADVVEINMFGNEMWTTMKPLRNINMQPIHATETTCKK
jgi:hypothetical protein